MTIQNITIVNEQYRGVMHTPTINPMLGELIYALAIDHPHWEFKNTYNRSLRNEDGTDRLESMRFEVLHNNTEIGVIGVEGWGVDMKYWVLNERVSMNSSRGHGKKTKDLTKAIKLVKKFFTEFTLEEVMLKAYEKAEHTIRSNRSQKHWALRNSLDNVRDEMVQYMADNWEQMKEQLPSAGKAGNFPTAYTEERIMSNIQDAFQKGTACLIRNVNGTYMFMHNRKPEVVTMTNEQLPNIVRLNLGLLKLLEPDQGMADVGIKINDELYVLLNPNGEQNEQATK